ncbi:MAG TPA: hypothetical protein P5079_00525 [Elusimicrobiota bacterium]|nr:hypothetical protein [Elusimicrobiota bacterium]
MPRLTRKKLDHFLSSLCEEAGMSGKPSGNKTAGGSHGLVCRAPCRKADWRAHLDIPAGILCVSAAWSANKQAAKHRDVTIAITFLDDDGKPDYADIVFCDSEIRWLMETLWHAPLWDEDR